MLHVNFASLTLTSSLAMLPATALPGPRALPPTALPVATVLLAIVRATTAAATATTTAAAAAAHAHAPAVTAARAGAVPAAAGTVVNLSAVNASISVPGITPGTVMVIVIWYIFDHYFNLQQSYQLFYKNILHIY